MGDPSEPLILGYDNEKQCWTEGDITAKVRSMSEPDRAVPLTARLEVVPDVLQCSVDGQSDTFRAHIRLKPVNSLPADDRATITIIADPLMEMGMQIMSAVSGMTLPSQLFKGLRAQVQVQLVPYCLHIKGFDDGHEFDVGAQVDMEGDSKTPLRLQAAVYRVDGRGARVGDPLALAVEVTGTLEGVTLAGPGSNLELLAQKPVLSPERRSAGKLKFTAQLPNGRILQRSVSVGLKTVTVELSVSPGGRYRLGMPQSPELTLTARNARGKAVPGLATQWHLQPAVGKLTMDTASTDEHGQVKLTYSLPTLEAAYQAFTGETLGVDLKVRAGPDQDEVASHALLLEFFQTVAVHVQKQGFQPVTRNVELTKPGSIAVVARTAAGRHDLIPMAWVSGGGQHDQSGRQGEAALKFGPLGVAATVNVSLELDQQSQDLSKLLLDELQEMENASWSTAQLRAACARMKEFIRLDYVTRLAQAPAENYYACAFLNLQALRPVVHIGSLSVQLFERRYSRFSQQLSGAFSNLAGAFYSWAGEKYFPKIAALLGGWTRSLFRAVAGKIAGRPWLLARARGAVVTMRTWLNKLGGRLDVLKRKVGRQRNRLPESIDQGLNRSYDLPNRPGRIVPGPEAVQAVEDAARKALDAKKLHAEKLQGWELLTKQKDQLQEQLARSEAAAMPDPVELARLRGQVQQAGGEAARAHAALSQAEQAWREADQGAQAARTALQQLKDTCGAFDEMLAAFMQGLSRIYEYGAWLIAYVLVRLGSCLSTSLRTVMRAVHPGAPDSLSNGLDDLVTKQAFTKAFELGGAHIIGPAIHSGLVIYQSYAVAVALEEAQRESALWNPRDVEVMKEALRWWYVDIDAASYKAEESEVWLELGADLVDWLEWLMVWTTRLVNVLLGLGGLLVSLLTGGAALPAWLLVSAGFTAFMEAVDRFWDLIKAVGRSLTSLAGAVEVWAVVLPAHRSFTAKLYGNPALAERIDRAWTYPIDAELDKRLAHLRDKSVVIPGEAILSDLAVKLENIGLKAVAEPEP